MTLVEIVFDFKDKIKFLVKGAVNNKLHQYFVLIITKWIIEKRILKITKISIIELINICFLFL